MSIQELLIRMGINPSLTGFKFLCDLILRYIDNPQAKRTAEYAAVGRKHNASRLSVEHSCRFAIEKMHDTCRPETYMRYLLSEPSLAKGKYETTTFIALAAEAYKREHPELYS